MSSFLLLLLILLCLSLHVCHARHLLLTKKDNGKHVDINHFSKDGENTKVFETSITSRLRPSTLEGCMISKQTKVKNGERNGYDSRGGANKQKDSNPKVLFMKQERPNEATSGNDNTMVMISSFQKELQSAMNMKGSVERNVRSLLGSAQHNSEETVDNVKENDDAEDTVVMDYAQPHRKPPIHNIKH